MLLINRHVILWDQEQENVQRKWIFVIRKKSIQEICRKELLDTATKTRLDALKTASKVYKAAETIGEFIGNKIIEKIVKPRPVSDENLREVAEIIIPLEITE